MGVAIPSLAVSKLEAKAHRKRRRKKRRRGEPFPLEKTRSGGAKKSKRKGASFEATVARAFAAYFGCSVRRTPGSGGWATVGDFGPRGDLVFASRKAPYHVECKKHEGWDLADLITGVRSCETTSTNSVEAWWAQTVRDCPKKKVPMLVFARNRMKAGRATAIGVPPLLMMRQTDLDKLATRRKNGVAIWNSAEFIPKLIVVNDGSPEMIASVHNCIIVSLEHFFKYVRPPKRSPRRNTWEHGKG
jgi:hypothetical protein